MGHIQVMNPKQRSEFLSRKYALLKESNKGRNYKYLSDNEYLDLEKKGYEYHRFGNNTYTASEGLAKEKVLEYRNSGYYSRIVCFANALRIKEFSVIYKKKKS